MALLFHTWRGYIAMTLGSPANQKFKPAATEVVSPCIAVSSLASNGLCIGRLRTGEESGKWLNCMVGDRARIMLELPQRLESLFTL